MGGTTEIRTFLCLLKDTEQEIGVFVDFSRKGNLCKNSSLICLSPDFIELMFFQFISILKVFEIFISK